MSIAQSLQSCAGHVDARLGEIFAELSISSPAPGQAWPDRLVQAIRHAALGGGKRFRPFLVIESAAIFGLPREAALDTAAAIECVHCYSLVHDDLPSMDNDELRRGGPTVWKAYDEWTAILAGDALQSLAFELLARTTTHPDANVRCDLVLSLARASGAGGMAGGQALDLSANKLGVPPEPSIDLVARLQAMKTGALIRAACEMGAILGHASPSERQALALYGEALGRAFQIADDLLDAEGDATMVGKAVAKDAAAGKATLVSVLGIEAARNFLHACEYEAIGALSIFGNRASILKEAAQFVASRKS